MKAAETEGALLCCVYLLAKIGARLTFGQELLIAGRHLTRLVELMQTCGRNPTHAEIQER